MCKESGHLCSTFCHQGKPCTNTTKENECDVLDLTSTLDEGIPEPFSPEEKWMAVGQTILLKKDETDLMAGEWLNDRHIHAAQQLLQKQYSHISGFQQPVLQLTRTYDIQKGKEFIQIFHANDNHCITISNIQCPSNTIRIYDTIHGKISLDMKTLVADLLQTNEK